MPSIIKSTLFHSCLDLDIWNQVPLWVRTIQLQLYKYFSYQFLAKSISKFKDQFHRKKNPTKWRSRSQTTFWHSRTQTLLKWEVFQDQHSVSTWINVSRLSLTNFSGGTDISLNWRNDYRQFYRKNFWHPLQITLQQTAHIPACITRIKTGTSFHSHIPPDKDYLRNRQTDCNWLQYDLYRHFSIFVNRKCCSIFKSSEVQILN